jgi:hypothetical protein
MSSCAKCAIFHQNKHNKNSNTYPSSCIVLNGKKNISHYCPLKLNLLKLPLFREAGFEPG